MAGYIEGTRASLLFSLLMAVALILPAIAIAGDGKGAGKVRSPGGEEGLLNECAARGTVKILVKVPLAGREAPGATEEQKSVAIAEAQGRLVKELSEKGLKPLRIYKYKYIPLMAMTVDTDVLKALFASDNVESVEADIPVGPTKGAG